MAAKIIRVGFELNGKQTFDSEYLISEIQRLESEGHYTGISLEKVAKCNSFVTVRGFDSGRGYLLMSRKDVKAFNLNSYTNTLKIYGQETIEYQKLLIDKIDYLTGGSELNDETLAVVELCDLRALGPMTAVEDSFNVYNIDETSYYNATKNGGSNWTYQTLINELWNAMPAAFGSLGTGSASFPSHTPMNYSFLGVSAWDALKQILEDIHHVLLLSKTGAFSIVPAGTDDGAVAAKMESYDEYLLVDAQISEGNIVRVPEKVRVVFPKKNKAFQSGSDLKALTSKDYWLTDPTYSIEQSSGVTGALAGTVAVVHNPTVALYGEDGTLSNGAALTSAATAVRTAYINALQVADAPLFLRYSGPCDFVPSANVSSVAFFDFGQGLMTEVRGTERYNPPSPLIDRNVISRGTVRLNNFAIENNGPPHIAQYHQMPERFVYCELYEDIEALRSGLARVLYGAGQDPITWAESATHEFTVHNISGLPLKEGTRGTAWFHEQTEKWLIISPPPPIVVFELKYELALGGEQTAYVCILNGMGVYTVTDVEIVVTDGYSVNNAMWRGPIGARGLCFLRTDGKYEIIYMQRWDLIYVWEATYDRDPESDTFDVKAITSFQHGDLYDYNLQLFKKIYDREKLFPRILKGCKGLAVYNDIDNTYDVLVAQQEGIYATAYLESEMCDVSAVPIYEFNVESFSIFGAMPENPPGEVWNFFGHKGKANDYVFLVNFSGLWVVIDVEKKSHQVVFDMKIDGDYIKTFEAECAVEYCEDPQWYSKIQLTEDCPT